MLFSQLSHFTKVKSRTLKSSLTISFSHPPAPPSFQPQQIPLALFLSKHNLNPVTPHHHLYYHASPSHLDTGWRQLLSNWFPALTLAPSLFPKQNTIFSVMWYLAFSDHLFSLSNIYLSSLHGFAWLYSSFFLALNNIPLSGCIIVYLSIHLLRGILVISRYWQL